MLKIGIFSIATYVESIKVAARSKTTVLKVIKMI